MPATDPNAPLRVTIAGFGEAGRCHAGAWRAVDNVRIVGVYSLRPDHEAADIAALCGPDVPVFGDYRRMLDTVESDFASICTLHDTHADYLIEAAGRGLHLLIEKPICLTVEELLAVRKAVKDAGIRAFAGFQEFHYGQLETTIDAVRKGYLGEVHLAQIEYYNGIGVWTPQHWWAKTKAIGGSSMLFCGCHPLMMMMNIMEGRRIAEVVALDTHSKSHHFAPLEYKATQVNLLRFEDGGIGQVTSCLDSLHPYCWRNMLVGSEGSLIDTRIHSRNMVAGLDAKGWSTLATRSISDAGDIKHDMFVPMFARILANLRQDTPMPYSDFDRAWEMHRILFACDEAAKTGRPVSPDAFLPA